MHEQITARIRDLGLAAALISIGYEINDTYKDDNGRTYFVFQDADGLNRAVDNYWSDTLVVRARKLSDNIKTLKSMIYAEK